MNYCIKVLLFALLLGCDQSFSGYVSQVATLGSDGGLSRYRLRLSPWIWLLIQLRNSRAWQDRSVIEIVNSVFPTQLIVELIKSSKGFGMDSSSGERFTSFSDKETQTFLGRT
jgi:uncharacterized protein involved in type VI secretion and phage assembly